MEALICAERDVFLGTRFCIWKWVGQVCKLKEFLDLLQEKLLA